MATSLFILASLVVEAHPASALRCSIRELRESPGYRWRVERIADLVDSASQIVRVRATRADPLAGTVTFQPLEWLRGVTPYPSSLTLPGVAVERDDFNTGTAPYQMVRSAGQHGDCFAREYRLGSDYLLLLQDQYHPRLNSIQWWPLGPVNEQLHGDDDPWLAWVRDRVAQRASGRGDT